MQCIIGLSTIHGVDPAKIHKFHDKLPSHIHVLDTMEKVKEIEAGLSIRAVTRSTCYG